MRGLATFRTSLISLILLSLSCQSKLIRRLEDTPEAQNDSTEEDNQLAEDDASNQIEEISPPHGLAHRPGYAFKELDPENPEMNLRHDIEHDEDGESEMENYFHLFEDYNYENIEKQMLKERIEIRMKGILRFYHLEFQKILKDESLDDTNVGPHLEGLLGQDFSKIRMDFKEVEISIKAALEKTLDLFFLYKCEDKTFHSAEDFQNCIDFKKDLKSFMMFQNFYELGFYNKIHDLFGVRSCLCCIMSGYGW